MSLDTPSRRSQRSNRKLPARYLDGSVEITPTTPQRKSTSLLSGKSQGKEYGSACQSIQTLSSIEIHDKPCPKSEGVSKRVRKVKSKTDAAHRFNESIEANLSVEDGASKVRTKRNRPRKLETDVSQEEGSSTNLDSQASKDSLQCETCGRTFSRLSSLQRHTQAAVCSKRLAIEEDMEEEIVQDEQSIEGEPPRKRRLVCKICRKTFVDKYTFQVHRRTHTGERPYHCTLCDKTFTQRSTLQFHVDTHSGQKHECSICGYKFTQARSLKRHMVFHTGEKEMKRKLVNWNFEKVKVQVENPESKDGEPHDTERVFTEMYECEYCKKYFKRVAELRVHLRVHTNERPYHCTTCGKSFKQLCHLNGHQSTHNESGIYMCEDCGCQFTQAKSLQRHRALQTYDEGSGKVQCKRRGRPRKVANINEEYGEEDDVKIGVEDDITEETSACQALENIPECDEAVIPSEEGTNNPESAPIDNANNQHICELCGKGFTGKNNFMQHKRTHSTKKAFSCDICHKSFRLLNYLKEHLKTHSQDKPYSCENCNKRFKTQRCLQNHEGRNSCTGVRPFTCDTCGKSFMYSRYLKSHRCHNTPVKMYSCGDCGKIYERRDRLIEHMRVHTGERPFVCSVCNKTFAKIANFRLHQRVHTGEKKYECTYCGKRFAHNSTLRYHESTHKVNKAFPCDQCEKQFPRSKALQAHKELAHVDGATGKTSYLCANCGKVYHHLKRLLKHHCEATNGKRFICGVCYKHFDREKQLEIHMRVHTGEKPYECQICGKKFSQTGGLKDHMLCHTREKKFQCDQCDVRFLRMKSLRKHKLIIHTGVEPQICKHCGATFKYFKALKKHEATHVTEQKNFTDILEDIEQAINNASNEVEHPDQTAVIQVVDGVDDMDQVAEVVVQDDETCQEIIITDHPGQVLHLIQDPEQLEIDQSIHELQIQAQLEEEERAQEVLMAVVASVDHHEEVVSAP